MEVLSYKQLCQQLGEKEMQGGRQRLKQLARLRKAYEIEKTEDGKYIIHKQYDDIEVNICSILNAPKQQVLFDQALYKAFIENNGLPLYLSTTDMLKLFHTINDNFPYTFDIEAMCKMGEDFLYMPEMSKIIYPILKQWIYRRIDNMDKRKIVIKREGFRLYRKTEHFIQVYNVPINSSLEKECQQLWMETYDRIIGQNKCWVSEAVWAKFERELQTAVANHFLSQGYNNMRLVTILSPTTEVALKDQLFKTSQKLKAIEIEELRERAKDKIRKTTTLDTRVKNRQRLAGFTKKEREHFIDFNLSPEPPFWFRDKQQKRDC